MLEFYPLKLNQVFKIKLSMVYQKIYESIIINYFYNGVDIKPNQNNLLILFYSITKFLISFNPLKLEKNKNKISYLLNRFFKINLNQTILKFIDNPSYIDIEDDKYIMALVANKMDLFEEQMIMDEEGRDAAEKYGIEFLTTSARENIQSFKTFTNKLIANYIENFGECLDSISLKKRIKINEGKKGDKSNRKKCCD